MEKQSLSPELLDRLSELLVSKMGLHVPKNNWGNWENKIHPMAQEFGFSNVKECVSWLTTSTLGQEELNVLAKHLTIGETYFFRDSNAYKALEEVILPSIIEQRAQSRFIRIWCAACCTGEEPYSIAMLLHRLIPNLPEWNISILGTDINIEFLKKCEKGVYKEWSFRSTPETVRRRYFVRQRDGSEKIIPEIRSMVKFMYLNLVEDKYPMLLNGTQAMDLILCNNILIYFSPDKIRQVVQDLTNSLVSGGWFLSSAVEVPYINEDRLIANKHVDTTIFQKKSEDAASLAALKTTPIEQVFFEVPEAPAPAPVQVKAPQPTREPEKPKSHYLDLYNEGRYAEVADKLESALTARKSKLPFAARDIGDIVLLARACANLGLMDKALFWTQQGLLAEKLNPDLHLLQGVVYQEMDRINDAVGSLQKALFLQPDMIIGYYVLGNLMMKKGCVKEGERNFRNALQLIRKVDPSLILPGSDGMTAGRLSEIISSTHQDDK